MTTQTPAQVLADYVRSLEAFEVVNFIDGNYDHMGATISDAILQAGVKYEFVVRPRIARLRANYPEATTTSAFLDLLESVGPKPMLEWSDDEKPRRIVGLARFLQARRLETESDLRAWLAIESNRQSLLDLRGIGPKTADYMKILVGSQTTAVDRHVFGILGEAGIPTTNYDVARSIVNDAADLLGIGRAFFDHSIWRYMSRRAGSAKAALVCDPSR